MGIYLLLFTILFIFNFLNFTKEGSKYAPLFISFFFILIIYFVLNREIIFRDDDNYFSFIEYFKDNNIDGIEKLGIVFYLSVKILYIFFTQPIIIFKILFASIWAYLFILIFKIHNINKIHLLFMLFCLFQVLFLIQLRNAFAILFLFSGLINYYKNKQAGFLYLIATLCHFSVIPFLLIFYYQKRYKHQKELNKNNNYKNIIISSLFIFALSSISSYVLLDIISSSAFLTNYISSPETGNTSIPQLMILYFHLYIIINRKNKINIFNGINSEKIVTYGIYLQLLFFFLPLFQRIILPFILFAILEHILYMKYIKSKNYFKIINILLYAIYFMIGISRYNLLSEWVF